MRNQWLLNRRDFVRSSAIIASSAWSGVGLSTVFADEKEVSPVEDLMREHGALNRILLIYDDAIRRIRAKEALDLALLQKSAKIIRDFIEGYHEKLEEEYVFPRLRKAGKLVDTVDVLAAQHDAGRKITKRVIGFSSADLSKLEADLSSFVRMYRPHEAREDTVVFPAFKKAVTPQEYDKLGDLFEKREHELFGKSGFEGIVNEIAGIERALGIYDLAKFTPKT